MKQASGSDGLEQNMHPPCIVDIDPSLVVPGNNDDHNDHRLVGHERDDSDALNLV